MNEKKWIAEEGWYRQNSANVLAGGNTDLITEKIAERRTLRITHYGTYVGDIQAWTKIVWSLRQNSVGRTPFDATTDQIGLQNQPVEISQSIFLSGGSILTVNAVNSDAAAHVAGFILKGEYGHFE